MLGPTIVLSEGLGTALEGSVKKRVCIRAPRCHNDKTTLDDITFKLCRYVCVDEWCICVTDYVGYQNGEGKTLPHAQGKVMRWRYKSLWWEAIPLSITSIGRWSALVSDISETLGTKNELNTVTLLYFTFVPKVRFGLRQIEYLTLMHPSPNRCDR